ncbi:MAG: hypothetical protein LBF22_11050, partial [Deltaproteobacteria bacterium]|nr:hypothetical protein [Deltaproteobacteria bacterium]
FIVPKKWNLFRFYYRFWISKLLSEPPSYTRRYNRCLLIEDTVFVIIELKYCLDRKTLNTEDKTQKLARSARQIISPDLMNECLANAVSDKMSYEEFTKLLSEIPKEDWTEAKRDMYLANSSRSILSAELMGSGTVISC